VKKRRLLIYIISVFILGAVLTYTTHAFQKEISEEPDLPNVVFIFADDLGYGDLSCYNPGSKINTPNIDRLASQGMLFTDAHTAASVCTPSRYGLLTGRYCWRTFHKRGVQGGYGPPLIEKDRLTIGHLFQQQGYKTAVIGKWHVGMEWTLKDRYQGEDRLDEQSEETVDHEAVISDAPIDHGFDYFFGTSGCTSDDSPFSFIENRYITGNPLQAVTGLNVVGDGDLVKDVLMEAGWQHEKADTIFTNRAIEFMKKQVATKTPFFVYLPLSLPHIPWLPPDFVKGETGAGPRGDQVALFDYCVGEVDKALQALGVAENTILIISSDNGPRQGINGHMSAGDLRGYKGAIFEGGHRVPLIVRWPHKVEQASVSNETVCMTDFMATFSALLNVPLSESAGEDSYNILPVLLQQEYKSPLRKSTVHHSGGGAFAIRKGDWKMIYGDLEHGEMPGDQASWEETGYLFNLKEDLSETNNLYSEYPEIVKEMNVLLREYLN